MGIDFNSLNEMEIDVLREVGNIGAGNAATALAKMLDKKVEMDVPRVRIMEFKEVNESLGGAEKLVVGVLLRVTGDMRGNIMFILDYEAACILTGMLMGRTPDENRELDELALSALKEVGNILTGAYISALSALTNFRLMSSVPEIAVDMTGAIISVPAIQFGQMGDKVLYIETVFTEGSTKVVGEFFMVPDMDSYDTLLKALGVMR